MIKKQIKDESLFLLNDFGLYYLGDDIHVVVPEEINGQVVTVIGHEGFANKSMQSIQLPATLIEIGSSAFRHCRDLQSITIPPTVERIAGGAFRGCYSLERITLHDRVTEIGSYAFDECLALTAITLPTQLEYIGAYAFSDTHLQQVILPEGIRQLSNSMFFNCQQLTHVTIPSTVQVIGHCAFAGCISLTAIELPMCLQAIHEGAFEFCTRLVSVTFGGVLKVADSTAFADCLAINDVTAPFTSKTLIEVYDEQREIFKNDWRKLVSLPKQELMAMALFVTDAPIIWTVTQAPTEQHDERQQVDHLQQAMQAIEQTEYVRALESLQRYSALYPNDAQAAILKGKIYYIQGELKRSILAYREAVIDAPSFYVHLGHALLDDVTNDASIAQYKETIWTYSACQTYDDFCIAVAKKALLLHT